MIGVYKITSPSGKVYVGQSWNILHRWADYGRKTSKSQRLLCFSFNKYGKKSHSFEVVHELPKDVEQSVLDAYEQLYMDLLRNAGIQLLNCREAGSTGKLSEETRKRVSASLIGRAPWNKGLKGVVKMSDDTKAKMSESAKRHGSPWNHGRKMSEHLREALRKVNTGRVKTEDELRRLSEAHKGKVYHNKNKGKVRTMEMKIAQSERQKARTDNKGEFHHLCKITDQVVLEIRSKFKPYVYTIKMLCAEYELSRTHIKDIIKRKVWRHI